MEEETLKHIHQVTINISKFIQHLLIRANEHDSSKLKDVEVEIFRCFTPLLKESIYGSDQYKNMLIQMKSALDHHYSNNRHHPEFFDSDIGKMNLIDIVEMFCDWVAAVKRHDNGNIYDSIEINSKRFKMSNQLKSIFINTVLYLKE